MTKRYSKNQELSLYQEEILNQKNSLQPIKKEEEKTYFPDLLTPYQRAILRGETPKEEEFFKKDKKTLHNNLLLCYIAGILGAAGLTGSATLIAKGKSVFQNNAPSITQQAHER